MTKLSDRIRAAAEYNVPLSRDILVGDDTLEQFATDAAELEAKLEGRWIPVETRLPIKEKWVLVIADGAMNCAWYDQRQGWHNGFNERPVNIRVEEITHWMPLPDRPPDTPIKS